MCIRDRIGELAGGLSDGFKDRTTEQIQWWMIRGMRNLFAHTYAKMDKKIIWDVATLDIPRLLHFCSGIMKKAEEEQ